jgi:hypothetical protein
MSTDLARALPALFSELVNGSPDAAVGTYMLNRGDRGLLHSLDAISAEAASSSPTDGATIAAHVDHIRYGLSLLNRWAAGENAPWKHADWTMSWRRRVVSSDEWQQLREDLRREANSWEHALAVPREMNDAILNWVAGSVAHLAYHLGAIRQIDRATRGPTAEADRAASTV